MFGRSLTRCHPSPSVMVTGCRDEQAAGAAEAGVLVAGAVRAASDEGGE